MSTASKGATKAAVTAASKAKKKTPPRPAPKGPPIGRQRTLDEQAPVEQQRREDPDLPFRQQMIADLIRLRELQGISQADVAKRMGITMPSVQQFERQTNWYLSTLMTYARAINCDLDFTLHVEDLPSFSADPAASGRPA